MRDTVMLSDWERIRVVPSQMAGVVLIAFSASFEDEEPADDVSWA